VIEFIVNRLLELWLTAQIVEVKLVTLWYTLTGPTP